MRHSIEAVRKYFGNKKVKCAELGVSVGDNARDMLLNYPEIESIHLVDVFLGGYAKAKDVSKQKLEKLDCYDKVIWHYMTTAKASKEVEDKSLDFVYVDAGHSYELVKEDLELWWPKIKDDGMMCGHDYNLCGRMEGIKQACDEFFTKLNLPVSVASIYVQPPYNGATHWSRRLRTTAFSDWWVYKIELKDDSYINRILQK